MPCRVDPIYVDYREENSQLLEVCNKATVMLDRAREQIVAGEEPNLNYLVDMVKFHDSVYSKISVGYGPYEGYPADSKLMKHFKDLIDEAYQYHQNDYGVEEVEQRQIEHRKEDIKRLRITFAKTGDEDRLAKTLNVDYARPLEEQLGFDPDEF